MRVLIVFLFSIASATSFSQTEPTYGLFWNNYSLFNPANTGLDYSQYVAVNNKYEGLRRYAPSKNMAVNADIKLKDLHGAVGIGYLGADNGGWSKINRAYFTYTYHHQLREGKILSAGASVSYDHHKYTFDQSRPEYSYIKGYPNLNVGVCYKSESLKIGLSSTHLRQPIISNYLRLGLRQYYLLGSYSVDLADWLKWEPSLLFMAYRSKDLSRLITYDHVSYDFNNRLTFEDFLWIGGTIRAMSEVGLQIGVSVKQKFNIGYAYEYPIRLLDPSTSYLYVMHEFTLAYMISDKN